MPLAATDQFSKGAFTAFRDAIASCSIKASLFLRTSFYSFFLTFFLLITCYFLFFSRNSDKSFNFTKTLNDVV